MTTKTNITLPSLPQPRIMPQAPKSKLAYGYSIDDMTTYARAAVEADRQGRMPSDEEAAQFADAHGVYYDQDAAIAGNHARALLSRYGSSQPAATPAGSPAIAAGFGSFSSDDRFWHAADRTWWRRGEDGMLVRADAPQPATSAEPVQTETITDGIRLPVDQMAGAAWNILDATGARVMIAGSLDGGKWTYRPALAAQVVKLLNDSVAAPVAQEPVAVIGADFGLFWIGSGPIAPIVKRHGLKVGSKLYAAPVAAQAQPVVNQPLTTNSGQDDETLADTQRAIIEAAEQRGYARAMAECGQDREDAEVTAYALPGGVSVERCMQLNGTYLWAVRDSFKNCLSRSSEWEYEPFPSSRTENWLAQHRFDSADAAIDAARAAKGADHA